MNTHFEKRLQRAEQQAQPTHHSFEVWLSGMEDDVLGPNGEVMSLAEFRDRYPDAIDIGGPHTYKE